MATKDEDIFKIYSLHENICNEINAMFMAIDELMSKNKFTAFSKLRWDNPNVLGSPVTWLPYFSQRMYRKENDHSRAIGLNLIMKYENCQNKIPFITCGLIKWSGTVPNKSDAFFCAGWSDDYPNKISNPEKSVFSLITHAGESAEILSYIIRLTAINTIEAADKLIVSPLNKMYSCLTGDWNSAEALNKLDEITKEIKDSTLTLEQVKR